MSPRRDGRPFYLSRASIAVQIDVEGSWHPGMRRNVGACSLTWHVIAT